MKADEIVEPKEGTPSQGSEVKEPTEPESPDIFEKKVIEEY